MEIVAEIGSYVILDSKTGDAGIEVSQTSASWLTKLQPDGQIEVGDAARYKGALQVERSQSIGVENVTGLLFRSSGTAGHVKVMVIVSEALMEEQLVKQVLTVNTTGPTLRRLCTGGDTENVKVSVADSVMETQLTVVPEESSL